MIRLLHLLLLLTAAIAHAGGGSFLGVVLDDEPVQLKNYGEKGTAVRILRVVEESPAQEAGIKRSDLLILMDGKPVTDQEDLSFYLRKREPGNKVNVVILRDGQKLEMTVVLSEKKRRKSSVIVYNQSSNKGFLGVTTKEINNNLLEFFGVEEGYGVLVDGVVANSAAARNGIQVGDVIVKINNKHVDSIGRLGRIARSSKPGTEVSILLVRDRKSMLIKLEMGSRDRSDLEYEYPTDSWPSEEFMVGTLDAAQWSAEFGIQMAERSLNGLGQGMMVLVNDEDAEELRSDLEDAHAELMEAREELAETMAEERRELQQEFREQRKERHQAKHDHETAECETQ